MLLSIAWLPSYKAEPLEWQGKQYSYKCKALQNTKNILCLHQSNAGIEPLYLTSCQN